MRFTTTKPRTSFGCAVFWKFQPEVDLPTVVSFVLMVNANIARAASARCCLFHVSAICFCCSPWFSLYAISKMRTCEKILAFIYIQLCSEPSLFYPSLSNTLFSDCDNGENVPQLWYKAVRITCLFLFETEDRVALIKCSEQVGLVNKQLKPPPIKL